jgi:hypothetical protein
MLADSFFPWYSRWEIEGKWGKIEENFLIEMGKFGKYKGKNLGSFSLGSLE